MRIFGGLGFEQVEVDEQELRAARVAAARRTDWTELEESHLVARGPGGKWLVDEPTDCIFVARRGGVFAPGRATIEFASERDSRLAFYLTVHDDVVLLERLAHPGTWSEHVERQTRRAARARPAL